MHIIKSILDELLVLHRIHIIQAYEWLFLELCYAGKQKELFLMVQPAAVISTIVHGSLDQYKRKKSAAPVSVQIQARKEHKDRHGAVFVSRSKEDLSQGRGFVVTSEETLAQQCGELTHWTPNTFYYGTYKDTKKTYMQGHSMDNLKQVNVFGFDIDTKETDVYEIFSACASADLPFPNVILSTPNGYQGFFILEKPFYIRQDNNKKAFKVAMRVSENIRQALKKYVPVDVNCSHFGFYRLPNPANIVYYNEAPVTSESFVQWSTVFEQKQEKPAFKLIQGGKKQGNQTDSAWYRDIVQSPVIRGEKGQIGRNNAIFTLALANYGDGIPLEEAYDVLDQFNSNLYSPLSKNDFERVIRSAYSGNYQGASKTHIEELLAYYGQEGTTYDSSFQGWYKFKKERKDRVRSHYDEWEQDIIAIVEADTSPAQPFLESSLRKLAERFSIPLSTLKEVLKQSKKLFKITKGKGRAAVTFLTSRSQLFLYFLHLKKEKQWQTNKLPIIEKTLPVCIEEYSALQTMIEEFHALFRSDTGHPIRYLRV